MRCRMKKISSPIRTNSSSPNPMTNGRLILTSPGFLGASVLAFLGWAVVFNAVPQTRQRVADSLSFVPHTGQILVALVVFSGVMIGLPVA